jgi:hypothetical protein
MFDIGLLFVQLTNSGLYTEAEGNRELSYQRALPSLAGENGPEGVTSTVMDGLYIAYPMAGAAQLGDSGNISAATAAASIQYYYSKRYN